VPRRRGSEIGLAIPVSRLGTLGTVGTEVAEPTSVARPIGTSVPPCRRPWIQSWLCIARRTRQISDRQRRRNVSGASGRCERGGVAFLYKSS